MVDPVATIVAARRMQHDIGRLQQRLSTVGQEVATGMKADVSGELRGRTSILLAFRDAHARTERYLESGATLTMRLDTMQLAMSAIRDTGEPLALETLAAVGREDVISLRNIQTSAAAALDGVLRQLNVAIAGRYLFGGTAVDQPPMVDGPDPAGVIAAVIGDAAAAAGGQIDVGDVPGLLAELDAVFDDSHTDATRRYATAFYQGSPAAEPDLVGQLDEDGRIAYGLKASELAFRDIVQGLHMLAGVRYGDPAITEAAYRDYATAAAERLQQGLGRLVDLAARTGQNQALVAANQERLDVAKDLYNRQVVELEGRDPYEAATILTTLEQQLEASYLITARMNELSLTSYLR
jgi:flagellar hook-associated protein 3 FlgL